MFYRVPLSRHLFVIGWMLIALTGDQLVAQPPPTGLRQLASPLFSTGVGIDVGITERPDDWPLLTSQFEFVTPENCMKVHVIQPAEGQFDFAAADRFVQFAQDNDLKVVGHCLIWARDDSTPSWMFQDGDQPASRQLLLSRLQTHIQTVVSRYKGKIAMWDVVNEALADDGDQFLRDSGWTRITGEEFLVKAFQAAHAADPDALLIYNDYRCDTEGKRAKLIRLVKLLQDRGAPIHAVGLQGHYELDQIPYDGIEQVIQQLGELGLQVVVSELDIDVIPRGEWWADGGRHRERLAKLDPYADGCPPEILQRQADQYGRLFTLFAKHSDTVRRVSFWNLHDGQSWLNYFPWDRVNHPLLFDRQRQPKRAFHAVTAELIKATQTRAENDED